MFYVYALSSLKENYIYVGLTSDLNRRFEQHNSGKERTTRKFRPFKLIFSEICSSRTEARIREKYWKSGIGKEKLRKLRSNIN
ncbi:GIY-YIG nuclease family protein [Salinimicrobium sp. MT39]|uniref:GIY-YIG nuclease family protein n=1 Tax=Salinimicrobium profundisediminis TaxID=2994553 RepID=A0A9X3I2B3_9FLAO|nr:GIY-YIG nuclease family protein [Salinimicrobium profundisediminis]MCX2838792.1 GIY-YIG nuclease family protein [Salinimicrobium profundisediminis]